MTQTISMTSRISSVAMLALASLPFAALATGSAHAGTVVRVSDLNAASIEGQATFAQRADAASKEFCSVERSLTAVKACRAGARAELNEKFDALRMAQIAQQKTFAAR